MKTMMKKIVMSLGLCLAINAVHASAGELGKRLGTLEVELKKLSGALSGLGKTEKPGRGHRDPRKPGEGGKGLFKGKEEPALIEEPAEEPGEGGTGLFKGKEEPALIEEPAEEPEEEPKPAEKKAVSTPPAFIDKVDFFVIDNLLLDENGKFVLDAEGNKTPNPNNFETFYHNFEKFYLNPAYAAKPAPGHPDTVNKSKDAIARAYFEKYIVDYCRNYIDACDGDRSKSKPDPRWVYNSHLKSIIEWLAARKPGVITAAPKPKKADGTDCDAFTINIDQTMKDAAIKIVDSLQVLLNPGVYKVSGVGPHLLECGCLYFPMTYGYDYSVFGHSRPGAEKLIDPNTELIPKDHALYVAAHNFVYSTMNLSLNHGFFFINRLIRLFDIVEKLNVDIITINKEHFRAGFDEVFNTKVIPAMIGAKEVVAQNLLRGIRKDADNKDVIIGGKVNTVLYGKKIDKEAAHNIYWCRSTSSEIFPDGVSRGYTPDYAGKDDSGNYRVTDDELIYAFLFYMQEYSSYSIGMIPYYMPHVLKLSPERKAAALKVIADANVNINEQKRLLDKADGVKRVQWVANYLALRLKDFKATGPGAPTELGGKGGILEGIPDGTKNKDNKFFGVALSSINEDEWLQIFDQLVKNSALIAKVAAFTNGSIETFLKNNLKTTVPQTYQQKKDGAAAKPIGLAILDAATAASKKAAETKRAIAADPL